MASRSPSRWPLLLALALLGAALGTVLWLRARVAEGERSIIDGTLKRFAATGVLGRPESREIVFEDVETLARASENQLVQRIVATKLLDNGREVPVRPFAIDLAEPEWRSLPWQRLAVGDSGFLYLQVNRRTIHAVNATVATLAALLAAGLGVLLLRQHGKEREVGLLTEELETRKAQMIRLERLALAGQLSANIFHDIKKPVVNIKHEVADALDGGSAPPPRELLQAVRAQTDLFFQMLRDLGIEAFVGNESPEPEWCGLRESLDRSVKLVQYEQNNIAVSVECPGDLMLKAHPHRLVQLFSNLALNAYQAMGGEGALRIAAAKAGDRIRITFEDTGPGIPPDRAEAIFSPFVTTKSATGGSGLGLYICRTIAEELGGTLALDPAHSGGARFVMDVRIP